MKKNIVIGTIVLAIYYLMKEIFTKKKQAPAEPRTKHLTKAFSKAKVHAINTAAG